MSKLIEASNNIKRLSVMFKGMIELADELDKVSSIENHIVELEAAKATSLKENQTLREENDRIIDAINLNHLKVQDIVTEADLKCKELFAVAEAGVKAKHEEAEKTLADLFSSKEEELKKMNGLIDLQNKLNETIKSEIEQHQVILKDLKEAIASIKEKF
jgi:hypothetical protein